MTQNPTTTPNKTTTTIIWPNDGKEMIFMPGGSFIMGSNDGNPNHQPQHQVSVAGFYLDRWPVTNAEYKKFIDATSHSVPNYEVSWCDTQGYNWDPQTRMYPAGKADHPVVLVTWEDAMAYAAWCPQTATYGSRMEGLLVAERLAVPWGDAFGAGRCNCKKLA